MTLLLDPLLECRKNHEEQAQGSTLNSESVSFPVDFTVGNGIPFRVPTCARNTFPIPLPIPSFLYNSDSVFRIEKSDDFRIGIGTNNK